MCGGQGLTVTLNMAKGCLGCQSIQKMPAHAPLHPWEWPSKPWQRVHVDYAGPFQGTMFLIIMDAHSKWPEVVSTQSTTSAKTIDILRSVFARIGLPEILISDNGPQLASEEFDQFTKTNGIKHVKSALYHPATNGLAEKFVQTFNQSLRAMKWEASSVERKQANFLMAYRHAPHATTNETPAKLFYGRNLRTRLDALKPDLRRDMAAKQISQAICPTGQHREFTVGQSVAVRNYRGNENWISGTVVSRTSPVSYQFETTPGVIWRRHIEQLRDACSTISAPISLPKAAIVLPSGDPPSSGLPGREEEKEHDATPQTTATRVEPDTSVKEKRFPSRFRKAPQKTDL